MRQSSLAVKLKSKNVNWLNNLEHAKVAQRTVVDSSAMGQHFWTFPPTRRECPTSFEHCATTESKTSYQDHHNDHLFHGGKCSNKTAEKGQHLQLNFFQTPGHFRVLSAKIKKWTPKQSDRKWELQETCQVVPFPCKGNRPPNMQGAVFREAKGLCITLT